jgi:glycosyltransferase involved in cell wall biosynthesis
MTSAANLSVLHVITESSWGGAQRIVNLLCEWTSPVCQVACGTGGRLIDELSRTNVPVQLQPNLVRQPAPKSDSLALKELIHTIRRVDPDVVHCHSTKAGILGRIAGLIVSAPVVFTVHGWGFYNTEYQTVQPAIVGAERLLSKITDRTVCVSENDLQQGLQRSVLSTQSATVIRNGIPRPVVDTAQITLREELSLRPEQVLIGAVARLAEQKAPEQVLRLGRRLRDAGHSVATVLVGDGPLKEDCERLAASDPDSYVLGFREDALACMAAFDLFALPSRFEGLPLTVLEAMHLGVPVIGYDVGGVSEAVTDGMTGRLVKPREFDILCRRAGELVDDEELRARFGKEAAEKAARNFTAVRMAQEYDRVYQQVV